MICFTAALSSASLACKRTWSCSANVSITSRLSLLMRASDNFTGVLLADVVFGGGLGQLYELFKLIGAADADQHIAGLEALVTGRIGDDAAIGVAYSDHGCAG